METKEDLVHWQDSFNTGNLRVDNQHKHMVRLINELYHAQKREGLPDKLGYIFEELFKYTINHFSMEEMIMREFSYDGYIQHKNEHLKFTTTIAKLKDRYLQGDATIKLEVLNFLVDWLLKHIIGSDQETFESIKRNSHT